MGWKPSHGLRRFGRYGFPFLISIVGASFALAEFTESRYIYSSRQVQQVSVLLEDSDGRGVSVRTGERTVVESAK